ncbi:MAG: hypothetical protein LBQ28_05065 [Prevotellaceae bacterium]|nr:hypothetical protein [Prevotellaceae bacterium]
MIHRQAKKGCQPTVTETWDFFCKSHVKQKAKRSIRKALRVGLRFLMPTGISGKQ